MVPGLVAATAPLKKVINFSRSIWKIRAVSAVPLKSAKVFVSFFSVAFACVNISTLGMVAKTLFFADPR